MTPSPQSAEAQEREAFEAHIRSVWKVPASYLDWALKLDAQGFYLDSRAADQWSAWLARASLPSAAPSGEASAVQEAEDGQLKNCKWPVCICGPRECQEDAKARACAPTPTVEGLTDAQIAKALAEWFNDDGNGTFEARMRRALLAASPVPMASSAGEPDYSDMSREQLERHAARMAQTLADDRARKFYERYAFGPMMPPSCLCCGKLPEKVAIQHAELPGVVICEACRPVPPAASLREQEAKPKLAVWFGSMPESNGKANWTVTLHREGEAVWSDGAITFCRSEYHESIQFTTLSLEAFAAALAAAPEADAAQGKKGEGVTITLSADDAELLHGWLDNAPVPEGSDAAKMMDRLFYALEDAPKADERGSAEPVAYLHVPVPGATQYGLTAAAKKLPPGEYELYVAHPDSAQERDAAQAVELTDAEVTEMGKAWPFGISTLAGAIEFARTIERAVLAKNGLGGKQ